MSEAKPKYDGGSAFPQNLDSDGHPMDVSFNSGSSGMSLRDYFAGQALSGVMAYYNPTVGDCHTNASKDDVGRYCYDLADSLLKARHEETGKELS